MDDLDAFLARAALPATPALVIRRTALLHNLDAMQAACDAGDVRLRPHGRMHKCPDLARLQVARGAIGLCCQTIGEAEAFVAGGIDDILVTAPLAPWAAPRLVALVQAARVAVVADDPAQIAMLAAAADAAGTTLDVMVDVDFGQHRAGSHPDGAVALACAIDRAASLRFAGVQAYLGHIQHVADASRRRAAGSVAADRLRALVDALSRARVAPGVVTGGGTGSFADDIANAVFTELQCGSYALMDAEYAACDAPGAGPWPFAPALFVAASVVSAQHVAHVTVDAGLKALAVDGPPPRVVAGAAPGSAWRSMGDEHGAIVHPDFIARLSAVTDPLDRATAIDRLDADSGVPAGTPGYGDIVWLQPGHCDPTINLYDAFLVIDEAGEVERWPITARRVTPQVSRRPTQTTRPMTLTDAGSQSSQLG